MEDKSFINLLSDENLSKIDIDSRLTASFKRVIDKLQTYFNANGYTSQRDYKNFFEEYLLKNADSKLRMMVSNEPSKIGAAGFYRHRQDAAEIHIGEEYLEYDELLDSIFCHEFIHFLAMRGLDEIEYPDLEIKNGGFINEALTEMLTQQIYPNSNSYQPQVDMLKFANLLTGNVNNYSLFLRGKVDCKGGASSWNNFFASANAYQKSWRDKGFSMSQAINDPDYIKAQQYIIQANIKSHLISSFDDYKKWFSILQQRPVQDNEFIDKLFIDMDISLLNNLGLRNENLKEMMYQKLLEYRQIPSALSMYDGKDVYEFEIAGHKVAIDKDRNLYGRVALGGYSSSWNPNTGIWELKVGNESLKLDINTVDFGKRKIELLEKQQTIPKYFSSNSKDDVKSVEQVAKQEGLVKLEKFTLPSIDGKRNPTVIYVATYNDRIEILNNPTQIGELENIKSAQYIGLTSTDPKVSAIYSKPLESIDKGIVFSKHNQKNLQLRTIQLLTSKITPTLTSDQITQLVEQYKLSNEYDIEDNLSPKKLQEFAIMHYAKAQYGNMSEEQKQALYDEVVKANERFVISTKDGKIDVSLLFGDKYITAFRGQSEVLVDTKGNGLYNEQFEILSKATTVKKESNSSVIKTGDDGNIIFSQKKGSEEKSMNEGKKTASELLNEYNQQLAELQAKYGVIAKQMEDLMQQNALTPIPNYQDKLNVLIQQRDKISKEMEPVIHSQKTFQQAVDYEKEQEHKAVISQVERLLSTRIKATTDTGRFVQTDMGMFPQMDRKDSSMLSKEQGQVIQRLNDLYIEGELDLKSKQKMVMEVIKEYQKMIKSAPKPIQRNADADKQRENNPNAPSTNNNEQQYQNKYGYSEMNEEERERFNAHYQTQTTSSKKENPEKKKLEEERRELRRKQFGEKMRQMGIDKNEVLDMDELFRQQQIIEKMNREREEIEQIEDHGMHM